MRKIVIIVFAFCSTIVFAQKISKSNDSILHSLELSVSSEEKLKDIKWNVIKEVFKDNVKTDSISLSFTVKRKTKKNLELKHSFKVEGVSGNIDELILISKKQLRF